MFDAAECYARIDNNLRHVLAHHHVPWGMIDAIEAQLVDYFLTNPDGLYVAQSTTGFSRLLLHTVAQYLALKSKSE